MVTGEFYGRVTIRWVTKVTTRVNPLRDKRPACRWLRSSSYNFPDQRDAVMKSLSKNFMFSGTRGGIENAIHERTHRPYVSTQRPDGRNLVCWKLLLIGKFCSCLPTPVAKIRVTPDPDTAAGAPDGPIPTAAPTEAPRAPARRRHRRWYARIPPHRALSDQRASVRASGFAPPAGRCRAHRSSPGAAATHRDRVPVGRAGGR